MKKNKNTIYVRYEFSDEKGRLEGGDIFEFFSLKLAQEFMSEAAKIAYSDGVAVNFTIGEETPFFGFLKMVGISRKEAEAEMNHSEEPMEKPAGKKTKTKAKKK
jgi:hypothetical protein